MGKHHQLQQNASDEWATICIQTAFRGFLVSLDSNANHCHTILLLCSPVQRESRIIMNNEFKEKEKWIKIYAVLFEFICTGAVLDYARKICYSTILHRTQQLTSVVSVHDFQYADPDALVHSAPSIIERFVESGTKCNVALKALCKKKGLNVEFLGSIKNQYYTQSKHDEVRSEWNEFV